MGDQSFSIVLPWPYPEACQNYHAATARSRFVQRDAAKRMRTRAHACALELRRGTRWPISHPYHRVYLYPPDNKKRDGMNWYAACKPYMDGLQDAGVIRDDCEFHRGEWYMGNPTEGGQVRINIEEV